ncbi:hypothetical protein A2U01_0051751, partial [Trifolium medium]|nr:hypothetical protein [Trifolium medium]
MFGGILVEVQVQTATIFPCSASGTARRSIWRDAPFLLLKA